MNILYFITLAIDLYVTRYS